MMRLLWGAAATRERAALRRKAKPMRPAVDGLEERLVLSAQLFTPSFASQVADLSAHAISARATINQKIVDFLSARVGKRIGGGECAHLATEALRVAGAKFVDIGKDSPSSGDYDWGTLVKVVQYKGGKVVDSNPSAAVKPGDVLQYRNATFSTGSKATHHTSVVAAVDSKGRPTKVYEQNIGNSGVKGVNRTVSLRNFDLSKLTGGWVRVYRPEARSNASGRYEFTLVNNSSSSQQITLFNNTFTLTSSNTAGSYVSFWATGGAPTLTLNGKTYTLAHGAGYEITGSGSSATLRKLSP